MLTIRDGFSHGLYADAGAMAFSDDYRHVLRLADRFGVPYRSLEPLLEEFERRATASHLRGRRIVTWPGSAVDWPYELRSEERALGRWGILQRYLLDPFDGADESVDAAGLPAWARAADRVSLADLLRERGASEGAVELIQRTFWFGHWAESVSAATSLLSDVGLFYRGQDQHAFVGGTDRLPAALAAHLGDRIVFGAEIVAVRTTPDEVRVQFLQSGRLEEVAAERAICTLPFPILRELAVEPALSEARAAALAELESERVTRVYLQVRRRFWEEQRTNAPAYTDLPIARVLEQPVLPPETAGERGLLEAYVAGAASARLDALSADERAAVVLGEMERVHPGVAVELETTVSKSWMDDRWARGAYTQFRPGQMTRWMALLQQPEGRIHFAGEHTSPLSGTMEGALDSGVRAAREVDEAS